MSQNNVWTISRSRELPLLANVLLVFAICGGMLWFGAKTDFKVHALIESILSLVSLFVIGVSMYLRKREGDRFFLIIALAFAGNWILEVWHVAASLEHAGIQLPLSSSEYSSSSWIAPRIYLGLGLLLALLYRGTSGQGKRANPKGDAGYHAMAFFALAPIVVLSLLISVRASGSQWDFLPRPEELIPGFIFAAAIAGYLKRGRWRYSTFEYYLLYSLGIAAIIHLAVMPFSAVEFDAFYAVAHFLKFTSYLIVLVGLVLYGRDISRDSLEDEKQRAETMLDIMDEGVLLIDRHYTIKSINPAGCGIFDLPLAELAGKDLTQWLPSLKKTVKGEVDENAFEKQIEAKGIRGNGSEFPAEITLNLIPNKRSKSNRQYVVVIRNISERQNREIERINLNRQLATALKAAGLGKWEWNNRTQCMLWDDQCDTIYGLPMGSRGMIDAELVESIHEDDVATMREIFANVSKEGRFRDAEFRIRRRSDGSERWIAMSGTQLVGEEDGDDRIVGVLRDITEHKNSMEDLRTAREAADEASQIKSAFLANMSHEIRTPMNGVVGMLDVLQESRLNSRQTDMVEVIKESAFSLLHLIDDILDFSKIEAGKLDIDIAPMDVTAVTESVCASLNLLAQEKGVELALFTDPNLPPMVMGDNLRLRQVLVNLANNAIKFSKDNTRTGKVCMRAVLVEEDEHSASIEFRVDDNGIGMTQDVQDAVFDIFVQADSSTSRKFGGTGLGLTISKNLVEMMGGEIDLFSVPGEGSTFTVRVTLPKASLENAEAPREWYLQDVACLLIEEPGGYSEHLHTYLSTAGMQIEQVTEVTEALQWLNVKSGERRVVVIDGGTAHMTAVERKLLERDNLGIVIIQRTRSQLVNNINGALVHSGNAMNRRHFLQLAAAAAGTVHLDPEKTSSTEEAHSTRSPSVPSRESAIEQNRLILVAEDNPTNQQVVLEQLSVLGYHAEIANNGEEGLEMWREGCFALLLTDLQMPKMDGYALTASIRAEETEGSRIPIVALSADALVGEAERSQQVGMDDYLAKPARMADLKAMLEKWLDNKSASTTPPVSTSEVTLDELAVLDVSQLEALVGTDETRINTLLNAYNESASQISAQLFDAWQAGDSAAVTAAAHQLKSSSLSIGAMRIGQLSAELEKTAKTTDSVPALDLMKIFEIELETLYKAIHAAVTRDQSQERPA